VKIVESVYRQEIHVMYVVRMAIIVRNVDGIIYAHFVVNALTMKVKKHVKLVAVAQTVKTCGAIVPCVVIVWQVWMLV
jgi:hypothetical protein